MAFDAKAIQLVLQDQEIVSEHLENGGDGVLASGEHDCAAQERGAVFECLVLDEGISALREDVVDDEIVEGCRGESSATVCDSAQRGCASAPDHGAGAFEARDEGTD